MKEGIRILCHSGFRVLLILLCFCLFKISFCGMDAVQAEQRIYEPSFAPDIIYTGMPTQVRVSICIVNDPKLLTSSVNLIRINPNGSKTVLARMYDDGAHGDVMANDEMYTALVELNEHDPAVLQFQVSAAYKGQLRRVLSEVFTLEVKSFPNLEGNWRQFVACLVNKDLEGALAYMTDSAEEHYRSVFSEVGMDTVAADFGSARDLKLKNIGLGRATYTFTATIDGIVQQGQIVFWLEGDGDDAWQINSVGF
jgi:hypothetical protein